MSRMVATPLSVTSAHKDEITLSHLLVLLSSLAALLAAVGLYGLIAFAAQDGGVSSRSALLLAHPHGAFRGSYLNQPLGF